MDDSGGSARRADEALLYGLGKALAAVDPVPPSLEQNARRLLSWRTVDLELGELLRADPADPPTAID